MIIALPSSSCANDNSYVDDNSCASAVAVQMIIALPSSSCDNDNSFASAVAVQMIKVVPVLLLYKW